MSDCFGGQISTLQVNNTDCSCVSIASIAWNPAGTQFTITLNNGQAITSPVLTGATGPAPTISFRVSGTTLQYSIDSGTTWVSIYNLSLLTTSNVLANQFPDLATLGTSYETLISNAAGTARNPWSLTANQLAQNLDEITIYASLTTNAPSNSNAKLTRVLFNGNTLNVGGLEFGMGSGIGRVDYSIRIVRITQSTAKYEFNVESFTVSSATRYSKYSTINQTPQALAGLDFLNNAYNIDVQGDSATIGDITCRAFEVRYFKKS